MSWRLLREVCGASLVIALGIILAVHFSLIWIHGTIVVQEPSRVILTLESIMTLWILSLGVRRMIEILRRVRR